MDTLSRTCVLVVAAGAPWEAKALAALDARPGLVVLKRCMDVTDLLASATTGRAHVAVVALEAPGLDGPAVDHLRQHGVHAVGVGASTIGGDLRAGADRLGLAAVIDAGDVQRLPDAVLALAGAAAVEEPAGEIAEASHTGTAIAVWGPTGAPGRTTVALGIAGELARRGTDPLVLDVDPWGGAVAQHLGVLDEVSGLLACARANGSGELAPRFVSLQRRVGDLRVVTGLPRPDRWSEVRAGTVERLVALGRGQGHVVLDTGFCLEADDAADFAGRPGRNTLTLDAVAEADVVVAVGSADPVGLTRLARGLLELRDLTTGRPVHVVVNRVRSRMGWREADIAQMVGGFLPVAGLHFLPEDRDAADEALLAARTLAELGPTPLSRAMAALVDALEPTSLPAPDGRRSAAQLRLRRRRTANTTRRR